MATITAEQRDALYAHIIDRLSGIGDVWLAIEAGDLGTAERLAREYSDELRLVADDLGWGEGDGATVELTTPPEVLRRVFGRMRETIVSLRASEEQERAEARDFEERNRLVEEACHRVLADVDAATPSPDGRDSRA